MGTLGVTLLLRSRSLKTQNIQIIFFQQFIGQEH